MQFGNGLLQSDESVEAVDFEQSLFSSRIRGEQRKTSKCLSVTVSMTLGVMCEQRYRKRFSCFAFPRKRETACTPIGAVA